MLKSGIVSFSLSFLLSYFTFLSPFCSKLNMFLQGQLSISASYWIIMKIFLQSRNYKHMQLILVSVEMFIVRHIATLQIRDEEYLEMKIVHHMNNHLSTQLGKLWGFRDLEVKLWKQHVAIKQKQRRNKTTSSEQDWRLVQLLYFGSRWIPNDLLFQ